jgi:phosphatidyl-myo-inositol dimannoside synthase
MKSLLITSNFPPQTGGISNLMATLALALGRDRVCCLCCPGTRHAQNAGFDSRSGPRIYYWTGGVRENYLRAVGLGVSIAQIMLRERPQAVQLGMVTDGAVGLWLNRWFNLPFIVYAHGNEILRAMRKGSSETDIMTLRKADRVLAVSKFTAQLVRQAGVAPERIDVVHPGCEVDRFRPLQPRRDLRQKLLGNRNEDRLIVTVGNLVERKGHDMVIRALPSLQQTIPAVTYLIVGDGSFRFQLETLATDLGVRDRVVFAGQVATEDLPDIYALSDVFVMPSRERLEADDVEGFGIVFLEASACGKPVIGSWSGGVPDAVVDGLTGLLVNPYDHEQIAQALARLLLDRNMAVRLGEQGRSRVVSDFNWTRIGDRVQGILEAVVHQPKWRSRRA